MACQLCLHPEHELMLLLVGGLQTDMQVSLRDHRFVNLDELLSKITHFHRHKKAAVRDIKRIFESPNHLEVATALIVTCKLVNRDTIHFKRASSVLFTNSLFVSSVLAANNMR